MSVYDASLKYKAEGVPLVVLAGAEYGTGSSRDWAAKGTQLLGVRAVIAVSYERIHRSNLVGMGILPLEFPAGQTWQSLGLTGEELYEIVGLDDQTNPRSAKITVRSEIRRWQRQRISGHGPHRLARRSRLLPSRWNSAARVAETTEKLRPKPRQTLGFCRLLSSCSAARYRTFFDDRQNTLAPQGLVGSNTSKLVDAIIPSSLPAARQTCCQSPTPGREAVYVQHFGSSLDHVRCA